MVDLNVLELTIQAFPLQSYDKIRYADTDRQAHVNNACFSTFLETGRVELLYNPNQPLHDDQCSFVIASQKLDLRGEIQWPGVVDIGTAVQKVGNSSLQLIQCLYQNQCLVATAETVIVHVDGTNKKSKPLSKNSRERLMQLTISGQK